jgi:hypothetical protein
MALLEVGRNSEKIFSPNPIAQKLVIQYNSNTLLPSLQKGTRYHDHDINGIREDKSSFLLLHSSKHSSKQIKIPLS